MRTLFTSSKLPKIEKIAVLGAAGGIGQPLSLQLKQLPELKTLAMYDVVPVTKGVGLDVAHVDTPAKVESYMGDSELKDALKGATIAVIPAGMPRKPGMTRDDLFNINAKIVSNLVKAAAHACPEAFVLIITNPVNSTVPIAATLRKRLGLSNKKLLGVTTLDIIRANNFVADHLKADVQSVNVPVIGGHAGATIIPVLSHIARTVKGAKFSKEDKEKLTKKVAMAGDAVVAAKAGAGSATLSMAYAATKFTKSVIKGIQGEAVQECSFVESSVSSDVPFFASFVKLGPNGYSEPTLPSLDAFESALVKAALPQLKAEIAKGIDFAEKVQL